MFWRNRGERIIKNIHAFQKTEERTGVINALCGNYYKMIHILLGLVYGSGVSLDVKIPLSTKLPHPNGVFIHGNVVIGEDCMIMQQVTITTKGSEVAPTLKRGVYIGSGAKVLGAVTIGENSSIGANGVVVKDIPAHCTAVGVPARVVKRKG